MSALAEGHVIDVVVTRQDRGNLCREIRVDSLAQAIVAGQLQSEHETGRTGSANRSDGELQEAHAAFKVAAEFIRTLIGALRHELVKQVSVTR